MLAFLNPEDEVTGKARPTPKARPIPKASVPAASACVRKHGAKNRPGTCPRWKLTHFRIDIE